MNYIIYRIIFYSNTITIFRVTYFIMLENLIFDTLLQSILTRITHFKLNAKTIYHCDYKKLTGTAKQSSPNDKTFSPI